MEKPPLEVCDIPLRLLSDDTTFQFREDVPLRDLMESVSLVGQKVPIKVSLLEDDRYQIIYGFRRVRALRELGQETVKAIIHRGLSEEEALKERFAENSEREGYSPYEWIMICRSLQERGYSRTRIGEIIGRSSASVSRYFQVLSHEDVLEGLRNKEISFREALKQISALSMEESATDQEGKDDVAFPMVDGDLESGLEELSGDLESAEKGEELQGPSSWQSEESPPWDSPGEGEALFPLLDVEKIDSATGSLPQQNRNRFNALARAINRTISETPFSQLPQVSFRVLPKTLEDDVEEEKPAVDILGLEMEHLEPFFRKLLENLSQEGPKRGE